MGGGMRPIWGIQSLRRRHHPGGAQRMSKMQDRNPRAVRAHMNVICIEKKAQVWV